MNNKINSNDLKRWLERGGVTVIQDTDSIAWQLANRSRKQYGD